MSGTLQRLEETYLATMLFGQSSSDFAVRSFDVEERYDHAFMGMNMSSTVASLARPTIAKAPNELELVFEECQEPNWNGYDAVPVHPLTYDLAQQFLRSLPSSVGAPKVNADPDGELSFDWHYGNERLLAVSIGLTGRLSFIYRNGSVRMRDTLMFLDQQIPHELVDMLHRLKRS